MSNWPDWFPDGCPPDDAVSSDDPFFRLVDADDITEEDFWSLTERMEAGMEKPRRRPPDPCLSAGVSTFDTADAAAKTRGAFGALRKKKIARGSLDHSGVVKQTGRPGHHTWWRPVADQAWSGFAVVS